MLKRTLGYCLIALSLCGTAYPRVHRGHRPREHKIFAARPNSVLLENEIAEGMGAYRYFTQPQVDAAVQDGTLVRLYTSYVLIVSPKLPMERRYALPATVAFTETLATEFFLQFHRPLMVDSAIRAVTTQRGLHLRNAAAAYGPKASSHERGTTVDISKHLTKAQQRWLLVRLVYYHALGQVLVINERSCYHLFVIGDEVMEERQVLCPQSGGEGGMLVTHDMAIDAGDRSLEGVFWGCSFCNGDGWILEEATDGNP